MSFTPASGRNNVRCNTTRTLAQHRVQRDVLRAASGRTNVRCGSDNVRRGSDNVRCGSDNVRCDARRTLSTDVLHPVGVVAVTT
eukprot:534388-Rhodomonas_salina.2